MKPSRWIFGMWMVTLLLAVLPALSRAQGPLAPPEVLALYDDINDIDKLRVINPLKMTPEQIDKIIAAVKKSQSDYNRSLSDAAVPPIREIAKDIKETRRKMLSGTAVPEDFDNKVKKIQDDFLKKRNKTEYDTLKALSDTIRSILTPDQVDTAISLARKLTGKESKTISKEEDAKYFNYYVLQVFIMYPRSLPLLEDIRSARSGGAARNDSARRQARR